MSNKPKFPRAAAVAVAKELCDYLKHATLKLIAAGSLRRRREQVGDVEILFMPIMVRSRPTDLFEVPSIESLPMESLTDVLLEDLLRLGVIIRRPSILGVETWGPLNKLAVHVASGIPVDFFSEPAEENWTRSVVIRTGPKALNIRLITEAAKQGIRVHASGRGLTKITTGDVIPCTSEREFFSICGVPYLEPHER